MKMLRRVWLRWQCRRLKSEIKYWKEVSDRNLKMTTIVIAMDAYDRAERRKIKLARLENELDKLAPSTGLTQGGQTC